MRALLIVLASAFLIACGPPQKGGDKLYMSDGVKKEVESEGEVTANSEKSRVRCERVKRTGSHMVTRVCYTQEEWAAREQQNRDALEEAARRGTCSGGLGCGGDG